MGNASLATLLFSTSAVCLAALVIEDAQWRHVKSKNATSQRWVLTTIGFLFQTQRAGSAVAELAAN